MEEGEHPPHFLKVTVKGFSFPDQLGEETIEGNPPHLYSVFGYAVFCPGDKGVCPLSFEEGLNAKVDVLCEPRVERDLLTTIEVPLPQGGEIEKTEIHRFLDLVNEVITEENVRYVCFNVGHTGCPLGVTPRIEQEINKVFRCLVHGNQPRFLAISGLMLSPAFVSPVDGKDWSMF